MLQYFSSMLQYLVAFSSIAHGENAVSAVSPGLREIAITSDQAFRTWMKAFGDREWQWARFESFVLRLRAC